MTAIERAIVGSGEKTLTVHWATPSQQPCTSEHKCWEINTYYIGRAGCAYLHHRDASGQPWSDMPIDADPLVLATAAVARHDNNFYSRTVPVRFVVVTSPIFEGRSLVFDLSDRPTTTLMPSRS